MWFGGIDERLPRPRKRRSSVNRKDLIKEQTLGVPDKRKVNRRVADINKYYEMQGLQENIQTINDIGDNKLGGKIKKEWEGNLKGALYGGAVGVLVGLATRNNPYIFGIIGLIAGRILIKKSK
ncbi:MAG TPA: hypothetical protein DCM40_38480 [Maribacter sp.]|jgi:hypothetical protein|nr:hypothetical protein [Maribacter sp.]|tara:strand:+ start:683 stop:1051 length:369 start_codon:yes stop_codon:yes gene_type:complete